jgi:hypothetical protein
MSAEMVARLVADLRAGRIGEPPWREHETHRDELVQGALNAVGDAAVVDVNEIALGVRDMQARCAGNRLELFDEYPCVAPPWERAVLGFCTELEGATWGLSLYTLTIGPGERDTPPCPTAT